MKKLIISALIVSTIIFNSCSIFKYTGDKYLVAKTLPEYYLSYLEPSNWSLEENKVMKTKIINYVKHESISKEYSILIMTTDYADVRDSLIQKAFQNMTKGNIEILNEEVIDTLNTVSYVVRSKLTTNYDAEIFTIGVLVYKNGFSYKIVLSNSFSPVESSKELMNIYNSLRFLDK